MTDVEATSGRERLLFHITTRREWNAARDTPAYRPPSLATEGFVHLSLEWQWLRTANRFYRGVPDLVLLVIAPGDLGAEVRMEPADDDVFPHLYGPLPTQAVASILDVPLAADGTVLQPPELRLTLAALR
jgi:uncharacterized protein (DUF952 family)